MLRKGPGAQAGSAGRNSLYSCLRRGCCLKSSHRAGEPQRRKALAESQIRQVRCASEFLKSLFSTA